MKKVKVSIIIPIYNVEAYIEECLISAVNQSLKDIEIICVNDGTPDNSMDIVKKIADLDERIVIINKKNGGLSSARNAGISNATGEYIYFLDSDDYITSDAMEILYKEASENNLDNIYFDADTFFEDELTKEKMSEYEEYYNRKGDYSQIVSGLEMMKNMDENEEFRPSACLQFIRREFLTDNNIQFYEGIIHEDNLFSMECVLEEERVKHIHNVLYKRRMRDDSIMTSANQIRSSYGYFICLVEILKKIEEKEYSDEIKQALYKRFRIMQSNAFTPLSRLIQSDREEAEIFAEKLTVEQYIQYMMLVKRMADERERGDRYHREKLYLEKKNQILSETNDRWEYNIYGLKGKIEDLENKIEELENSLEYRTGKALFTIPSGISELISDIKKNGFYYAIWKFKNRFNKKAVYVSIIIPVYNAQRFLRACLETVMQQTLQNIEIICVNDGSTDNSLEILEEFAAKDKRFRIIDKENTGAGDCRNIGLKQARGEYLLFLDADDKFSPMLCEKTYFKAKKDKADICFFGAIRYDMSKKINEPMDWVLRKKLLPKKTPFQKKELGNKYFQMVSGCPWSKMFRRQFIMDNQIEFQNLKNANDLYFVRTAMALANNMTYVKEELVTYRFASGTSTQAVKHRAPLEFYKAYKALKERLIKEGVYKQLKQSFINLVFEDCIFNYRSTSTEEAKQQILELLLNEGFEYFEINRHKRKYFYNKNTYQEYCALIENQQMENLCKNEKDS